MVSKFTSRNSTDLFRKNSFRWAATYLFVVAMIFGGFTNVYAQPTFNQCDNMSNVTLQPGGADFELNTVTIPAFLGVSAVASPGGGTVTYTASPNMLTCQDITNSPITVTITVSDDNGTSATTCITNVTVADGGPAARCMDFTAVLTATGVMVNATDFDNGSSACTAVTVGISENPGGPFLPTSRSFTCADFMASPTIPIFLQATDANTVSAVCGTPATLTLQDQAPMAMCMMNPTIQLDAMGNYSLTVADVDNGSTTGVCGGGMTDLALTPPVTFTCADITTATNPAVTVTLTATNASGQTSTCTSDVIVQDAQLPVANCNNITISLTAANGNYTLTPNDLAALSMGSVDNCALTTTVSQNTFSCADVGSTVIVTVTVIDPAGNSDNCTASIMVQDTQDPVLVGCPTGDFPIMTSNGGMGNCFGLPTFNNPTITESCPAAMNPLTVSYMAGTPAPVFALPSNAAATPGAANTTQFPVGQTIVTFTATDAFGQTDMCSFTVTVTDDEVPTIINCPPDINVNVDANECDNTVSILPPTGNDNCGGGNLLTIVQVIPPSVILNNSSPGGMLGDTNGVDFADFPIGTTTILYGYRDAAGNPVPNADICTVNVTVVDNIPPTITCPPNQTLSFGSCMPNATLVPNFIGLSSTTDNCPPNNVQQFPPAGTAITAIPGFTPADGASFNVRIIVADTENEASCDFTVTLDDNNMPVPDVNPLPTLNFTCGNATVPAPSAQDACGNTLYAMPNQGTFAGNLAPMSTTNVISFPPNATSPALPVAIPDNTPTGITIDLPVTGIDPVISGLSVDLDIDHTWVGDLIVELVAPNGTVLTLFDRPGVPVGAFGCPADNINTTFSDAAAMTAADFENACANGMLGIFQPVSPFAAINNSNPNGTWQLRISDNGGGDTGSLTGISLNISTVGSIPQPTYEFTPGNYTVQWTFTDVNNNIVNQIQQINVAPDTEMPVLNCPDLTLALDENGVAVLSPTAFTNETLDITAGNTAAGGPAESTEFCITAATATTIRFNWDYQSFNSNAFFDPFGYRVNGTVVTLATGDPVAISDPASITQSGVASVNLVAGDQFCFVATTVDGQFGGASTSISNFIPGFMGDFAIGNWMSNQATLALGGTVTYNAPSGITDNCGVNFNSLTVNGQPTFNFDCNNIGSNPVTISVMDVNGNPGVCTPTVTIVDDILPGFTNIPVAPINVSCSIGADTTGLNIFATDNCGTPSITYNRVTTQTGNPNLCSFYNYTVRNIYTATDGQNNQVTDFFDMNVSDTEAPVFNTNLGPTASLSVGQNCTATVSFSVSDAIVTDNCAMLANLTVSYFLRNDNGILLSSGTGNFSAPLSPGIYTLTYTATDPCGNATLIPFVRTYTIIDDTPPFASCNGGPFTIGIPSNGTLTIPAQLVDNNSFDNCNAITTMVTRPGGLPATFTCAEADGVTAYPITLTVTDVVNGASNTCTSSVIIQDNIPPQVICQNITVSLDQNGNANITPQMIDGGSFDACNGLNTSSLVLDRTNFGLADVGQTIPVTLSASDNNGNVGSCVAMVTVTPPPTCFQVGQALGGAGEIIEIPVRISDFVNVLSFQFTLENTNAPIAEFVGTNNVNPAIQNTFLTQLMQTDSFISMIDTMVFMDVNGMDSLAIDTTYTPNFDRISISFVSDGPAVNLPDNTIAFNLQVRLTGNLNTFSNIIDIPNAAVTPSEIVYEFAGNNAPVLIPAIPCLNPNGPGSFGISRLLIAGQVITENGAPVNLVDTDLRDLNIVNTPIVRTDQTGPDGNYILTVTANSDYRIIPSKLIRWDNGIDIEDVAAIQRHAVGNVFLDSPYKKIAADVSNDNRVTGFDANLLNEYLSTALLGPPPANNTSWRFVDADQMLPNIPDASVPPFAESITILNVNSDTLRNNFIGVKIGDVAGMLADPQVLNEDGDTRGEDLIFVLEDQALQAGQSYDFGLRANNFNNLVGYQWILNFDPSVVRYTGNETIELNGNASVGTTLVSEGKLILTWYNGTPTTAEVSNTLFNLSFEARENVSTIQNVFKVTELEQFAAVAYNDISDAFDIKLEFDQPQVIKDYRLLQNQPNPFRNETVIGFELPTATKGTLEIMDVTGKVIKSYPANYNAGYNEVTIAGNELPAVGVLYYQLRTAEFTATKKMILID